MYFPINVDLREKDCLVVGGGSVARRKVLSLLQAGANVSVVSPQVSSQIQALADQGNLKLKKALFEEQDVSPSTFLVIGATDQPEVQREIAKLCRAQDKLVNIVDQPEEGNFTVPSKIQRGRLTLTISTEGASPGLSRRIRQKLESQFGHEYAILLDWLAGARKELINTLESEEERKQVFDALLDSSILDLLKQNKEAEAKKMFNDILKESF